MKCFLKTSHITYQSHFTHNPKDTNPSFHTNIQTAAPCAKPGTFMCMPEILFFLTFHNHAIHQLHNRTATTYHFSGGFTIWTANMTSVQSLIDCEI